VRLRKRPPRREAALHVGDHEIASFAEPALRLRRNSYRTVIEASAGEAISELTASRDLQAMVKAGLLTPRGETRGRYYVGSPSMLKVRDDIRAGRPPRNEYDPFVVVAADALQLSLDTG
jgi:hypothetical protein